MKVEGSEYQLKPMNCPFHIMIYKSHLRSYRDFPIRYGELGTVYRYERTGVLHGLAPGKWIHAGRCTFILPSGSDGSRSQPGLGLHILRPPAHSGLLNLKMFLSTRPEKSVGSDERLDD